MKLLFDENLSPILPRRLGDLFRDSVHVHDCGLGTEDDAVIWNFAAANGFAIISKDFDFCERSMLRGSPPKVIWLRLGNGPTSDVERLLRGYFETIERFGVASPESLLVLP